MSYKELMELVEGILQYYKRVTLALLDSPDPNEKNMRYAMRNLKSDIKFRIKQLLDED